MVPAPPASTRIGPVSSSFLADDDGFAAGCCGGGSAAPRSPSYSGVSVPELHSGAEGLLLCNGEDQEKALPAAEVIVPDGSIVLLASRVQNVDLDLLPVQNHFFPVAVGLGGLVVLHELWKTKQDTVWYLQMWTELKQGENNHIKKLHLENGCQMAQAMRLEPTVAGYWTSDAAALPHHTWTAGWGPTCPHRHCPPWSPCAGPGSSGFCLYWLPCLE